MGPDMAPDTNPNTSPNTRADTSPNTCTDTCADARPDSSSIVLAVPDKFGCTRARRRMDEQRSVESINITRFDSISTVVRVQGPDPSLCDRHSNNATNQSRLWNGDSWRMRQSDEWGFTDPNCACILYAFAHGLRRMESARQDIPIRIDILPPYRQTSLR